MIKLFCIVSLVLFSSFAYAQELPEEPPSVLICDITQDVEIKWGTSATAVYGPANVISYDVVNEEMASVHQYYTLNTLITIEAMSLNSTEILPEKAVMVIEVIPPSGWWGFARIRWRQRFVDGSGVSLWSDDSYWVRVINLQLLTARRLLNTTL